MQVLNVFEKDYQPTCGSQILRYSDSLKADNDKEILRCKHKPPTPVTPVSFIRKL
jgi:hypothetical protein